MSSVGSRGGTGGPAQMEDAWRKNRGSCSRGRTEGPGQKANAPEEEQRVPAHSDLHFLPLWSRTPSLGSFED